jgi:cyclopropane fatty-acyl-phospholipid synthase-like methyltransferase
MRAADLAARFDAPESRRQWTVDALARHIPGDRPARILDLGCGSGGLLIDLARRFPQATLTGVDINQASLEAGREAVRAAGLADRIQLIAGDYLQIPLERFDFIVAISALQFIDASDGALFTKLAGELAPGGHLLATIAVDSWHNRSLNLVRRGFHYLRGPTLDRLAFAAARIAYRGKYPDEIIQQRVPYIYVRVYRFHGTALDQQLQSFGLALVDCEPEPRVGLGHMRHDFCVYSKS